MTKKQQAKYEVLPFVKYGGLVNKSSGRNLADTMSKRKLSSIIAKRALVAAYNEENDVETCIVDLLADLRHLCDTIGLPFYDLDKQAYVHYSAEVVEARHALSRDAHFTGFERFYTTRKNRKEVSQHVGRH